MSDLSPLFESLNRSRFRNRFQLSRAEKNYLQQKGMRVVLAHARVLLEARIAPANPPNDGKQTPMRGHPVFVAQHATASCCRGCLAKWHGIERGSALNDSELKYLIRVLKRWLEVEMSEYSAPDFPLQGSLFAR